MRTRFWLLVLLFLLATPCIAKAVAQESPVSPQRRESPTISTAPSDKANRTRETAVPRIEVSAPKDDKLLKVTIKGALWVYILIALAISLGIRIVLTLLYAIAHRGGGKRFPRTCWEAFSGFRLPNSSGDNKEGVGTNDYLHPFFLGIIEVAVFPVLIASGHPQYVGGWFVLKTIARWGTWERQRDFFNRFLIGNALVLIASYFMARCYIVVP